VIVGVQERDLTADQLGVLAGPPHLAKMRHLSIHLRDGVRTVDADAIASRP